MEHCKTHDSKLVAFKLTLSFSICVLALVRIGTWQVLFSTDITYDTVLPFIITSLEPILGVILASLPFVRTAGAKTLDTTVFSWAKSLIGETELSARSSEGLSRDTRKDHKSGHRRRFARLDDPGYARRHEDDVEAFPLKVADSSSGVIA